MEQHRHVWDSEHGFYRFKKSVGLKCSCGLMAFYFPSVGLPYFSDHQLKNPNYTPAPQHAKQETNAR